MKYQNTWRQSEQPEALQYFKNLDFRRIIRQYKTSTFSVHKWRDQFILIVILLSISLNLQAQVSPTQDSLNQEVSPKGGVNALAIKYYGINFTKEQRLALKDKEIEFIFHIDEYGNPTLSEINGINNPAIIDSLRNKTNEIEPFNPRIRNGTSEPSIYFMQLIFPTYKMTKSRFGLLQGAAYNEAKLEDFEYITPANTRLDMTIGGVLNQFIGDPAKHLRLGGGMKVDISITGKKSYIYGLNMSFYGNKLKTDYPLNTTREQFTTPPTLLVGAVFGKWFNKISIQSELNIAVQNITEKIGDNDPEWVQLKGWSPGVVVNYPINLGKPNPMYYYGRPALFENNLNLHLGLRYLFLSIPQASGIMAEFGLSYRMTLKGVKAYKLNDEFYNRGD